jgi:putative flippase GtrA
MRQLVRFLLVGMFNTGFGYCIIFFCMYALKLSPEVSNILGYAMALGGNRKRASEILKFLVVFSISYGANFGCLIFLIHTVKLDKGVSQILAGIFYVGVSFAMNKYYVFKRPLSG